MSRLLIDEAPLQVLPSLATAIGLNEALFLQQLHYRLGGGKLKEGRRWFSRTYPEWLESDFPFWSDSTLKRIVKNLRSMDLIDTTKKFGAASDQSLWYAVNYETLQDIELGLTEKPAPSASGQIDTMGAVEVEKPAPSASGQIDTMGADFSEPSGQFDTMSPYKNLKPTPTPPTPSPIAAERLEALAEGGVGGEFQDWAEHLGLRPGPGMNITLALWASWVKEGLSEELKAASVAVILMGGKATDPAAVLKARMERQREKRFEQSSAAAAVAARGPAPVFAEDQRVRYGGQEMIILSISPNGTLVTDSDATPLIPPSFHALVEVIL